MCNTAEANKCSQGRRTATGRNTVYQTTETKTMTLPVNESVIVSRYGNRVVEWDALSLRHALNQLRSERQTYPRGYDRARSAFQQPITGEDSQRLIRDAERIKTATENKIREVESSA
jgi:hypothetical protein